MATVTGTKRLLDITGDNITTAVSLEAEGTLLDSNGTSGTSGQLLSSTGTGVDWVSNNSGSWDGIYSGSAQITGSLGVTGSINTKGGTDPFRFQNNLNDVVSFQGNQVNITKADDSIYASFGIGTGTGFTFQNPNIIVLGDDEGIGSGMVLELDMDGTSMTLNGGTYFQTVDNGGDIWEVVDGDQGIRTKIESDGLGGDNSFWQKGGSNTSYSHMIGYEFGTNNDLKIGANNCYNIDLSPANLVNIKNGKLTVFQSTTSQHNIFLGGNSNGGGTGVNFSYSSTGLFQINDSNMGEGFFQKGANNLDIKIGDFDGVINETYIEIDDTDSKVVIPNGDVGIGTENPSALLHVGNDYTIPSGYTGINTVLNGGAFINLYEEAAKVFGIWSDPNGAAILQIDTDPTNLFLIDPTDDNETKVGIGTATPSARLHVSSSSEIIAKFINTTEDRGKISISSFDTTNYIVSEDGKMSLGSGGAVSANNLTIASSGNVGIGTSIPARKLQVSYSSTTAPGFSIKNTNTTVDNNVVMAFNRDNSDSLGWTQGIDSGDNSFKISEDGDNLETNPRIVILSGGNVGIGTTSPSEELHVVGRAIVEDRLAIGGDFVPQKTLHLKNAAPVLRFEDSDITGGYLDMIKTSRNMKFDLEPTDAVSSTNFDFKIGGTTHLYMKNSQVGIMNDSPTEALDVTGNVQADTLIATDLADGVIPYHRNGTYGLQEQKMFSDNTNIYIGPSSPPNFYSRLTVQGSGISTTDIEISGSLTYQEPTAASEFNGEIVTFGTFIETPAAGDLICFNNSLGTSGWREANNSFSIDSTGMLGIAVGTTPTSGILLRGFARSALYNTTNLGTTPAGKKVYISSTNGILTTTIPTSGYVRIVGYVVEADATDGIIYFCPDNTFVEID